MAAASRSTQLTGRTVWPYSSSICRASRRAGSPAGSTQLSRMTKGLWIWHSSAMTRSSASLYFSRGMSLMEPSVVMTRPMVEWSRMTLRVPVSAATSKGTSSSNQGLLTMRGFSFSSWPMAPSTM